MPRRRGNVRFSNLDLLNTVLYVAENGCKWRALAKEFGNWNTIYVRLSRWAKSGVPDHVFEALQRKRLINIKIEVASLDSAIVKAHPDGAGALKKRTSIYRQIQRRMDNQNSYGCRECRYSDSIQPIPRASRRCARGKKAPAGGRLN